MIPLDLKAVFQEAIRKRSTLKEKNLIGTEYEQFVIRRHPNQTPRFSPLPVQGDNSIKTILERMYRLGAECDHHWTKEFEGDKLLALKHASGRSVTVEPGGQIEFSGSPLASLEAVNQEIQLYMFHLLQAVQEVDSQLFPIAVNPLFELSQIPLLDKKRYGIMYPHMAKVGSLGQYMMKLTSSIQINVDYDSIEDLETKFVILSRLSPFLTAMFANSPLHAGQISGRKSFRAHIWMNTDPARSSLPPCFVDKRFRLDDYINWALKAPSYLIKREGQLINTTAHSFETLMKEAPNDLVVTEEDWKDHLGMLFPDVRVKNIIEVRTFDSLPSDDVMTVPALIKALVYHPKALQAVQAKVLDLKQEHFPLFLEAASLQGLEAEVHQVSFKKMALFLFETALEALGSAEEGWLMPYFERYVKHGRSPADRVLDQLKQCGGDLNRWAQCYIDCAAFKRDCPDDL